MNDKENGGISLPMAISLIKKLGGDGSGAGGEYLPLSGGEMNGNITFNNNLNINMKTVAGVPKSLMNLSDEDKFIFGNQDVIAHLYSEHRPYIHVDGTTQQIAYLSDVLPKAEIQILEELPLTGETNVMYFVKDNVTSVYAIFLWDSVQKIFVLAGDSNLVLDDYYTKTQTDNLFLAKSGGYMTGAIGLSNNTSLYGISTDGSNVNIATLNNNNTIIIGSDTNKLHLRGNGRPEVKVGNKVEYMALLSDINSSGVGNYLPLSGGKMNGNITFKVGMLYGTSNDGETIPLVGVSGGVNVNVGGSNRPLMLQSSQRPSWNNADSIQELSTLQDIDTKIGKDYRVISETLEINGVVSTIATFDAPDVAQALENIQNYEITFNYSYVSSDGKLIIENHLGTSDNNELMQVELDIPSAKNVINIEAHALDSTISITNFVITCHIRPLNLDM